MVHNGQIPFHSSLLKIKVIKDIILCGTQNKGNIVLFTVFPHFVSNESLFSSNYWNQSKLIVISSVVKQHLFRVFQFRDRDVQGSVSSSSITVVFSTKSLVLPKQLLVFSDNPQFYQFCLWGQKIDYLTLSQRKVCVCLTFLPQSVNQLCKQ